VLRFACRLVASEDPAGAGGRAVSEVDAQRRFVLSFFVVDQSFSVYEPPVPNSGVGGGKFLERCKACKAGSAEVGGLKGVLGVLVGCVPCSLSRGSQGGMLFPL
jgi:hypothetical protein